MSSRTQVKPEVPQKPTDLLVRQKCEAMIQYGYAAPRQFPAFEKHVLATPNPNPNPNPTWSLAMSNSPLRGLGLEATAQLSRINLLTERLQ